MKLIFTKSELPLSLMIRYGLNEPVSHFGIVFDNGIVFHSNLLGTQIAWYGDFIKHCDIVYSLDYSMNLENEENVYKQILNTYDGKGYDYGAFMFFIYSAFMLKVFKKPMPKTNPWGSNDKFLCTELAKTLPSSILPQSIANEDLGIISPYHLYMQLKDFQDNNIK